MGFQDKKLPQDIINMINDRVVRYKVSINSQPNFLGEHEPKDFILGHYAPLYYGLSDKLKKFVNLEELTLCDMGYKNEEVFCLAPKYVKSVMQNLPEDWEFKRLKVNVKKWKTVNNKRKQENTRYSIQIIKPKSLEFVKYEIDEKEGYETIYDYRELVKFADNNGIFFMPFIDGPCSFPPNYEKHIYKFTLVDLLHTTTKSKIERYLLSCVRSQYNELLLQEIKNMQNNTYPSLKRNKDMLKKLYARFNEKQKELFEKIEKSTDVELIKNENLLNKLIGRFETNKKELTTKVENETKILEVLKDVKLS